MRAFLDTNVLLDCLVGGRPSSGSSAIIWEEVRAGHLEAFVTTQSILDMAYVAAKADKGHEIIRDFISWMIRHVNVESLDSFDIINALKSLHDDFEDNVQLAHAEMKGCDVFITNDRKILNRTDLQPMKVMTPEQFVNKMSA